MFSFRSITKLLVDKNADPNIILPGKGISCFHLAIGNDLPEFAMDVATLIIQNGGDPNVLSDEGLTPVHVAAAWGRVDILRLLLYCGGDPQLTDNCYKTALQYALEEDWEEVATLIKDFISCQRLSIYDNLLPKEKSCTITLGKCIFTYMCTYSILGTRLILYGIMLSSLVCATKTKLNDLKLCTYTVVLNK